MKLGLKYFESGYGTTDLPTINGGSWDAVSNFPADLAKVLKCASIPEDDGTSLAYAYKYIPEGLLVMIAKRMSVRGRVSRGVQAFWIFVPAGTDISADNLVELMRMTSQLFSNLLIFANTQKYETATKPLFSSEWGMSSDSISRSGNMKGSDLAIVECLPPVSLETLLAKGFRKIYDSYGLIVVNLTGETNINFPVINPDEEPAETEVSSIPEVSSEEVITRNEPAQETHFTEEAENQSEEQPQESVPDLPPPLPGTEVEIESAPIRAEELTPLASNVENIENHNQSEQVIPPPFFNEPVYETTEKEKSNRPLVIALIVSIFLIGCGVFGWLYYDFIYLPEKIDREAPRKYPIVNLFLRSSKMSGSDFNKITSVPAGSEIIVYEDDGEWSRVKYIKNNDRSSALEGYMASEYLIAAKEMGLLNSIFADNEVAGELDNSRVRKGLLEYFKNNNFTGKMDQETASQLGISTSSYNQWQVMNHHGGSKPNEIFFKRAYNKHSKYKDLAVIIENISSGNKKLLYFTYDDNETPHLRLATDYYSSSIKDIRVSGNYLYVTNRYGDTNYYYMNSYY